MSASLIITTYNWPEALCVTLYTVIKQSIKDFEVIIADDGSGPETVRVIKEIIGPAHLRWVHVRHHDKGIRQARIKNLGVKYSNGDYLIFIDHDVVLHPNFIEDHVSNIERGCFLQGKRAFLPERYTKNVLKNRYFVPPSPFLPKLENRKNALRCPRLGRMLSRVKKFQTTLRGCNFSLTKSDFVRTDGYDETFDQLWGREDSDICYRLFHCGMRIKNLGFSALQYHLFHNVIKNRQEDRLDQELLKIIKEKRKRAVIGFSKLSSEGEVISGSDVS